MGLERKNNISSNKTFVRKPYDKQLYKWSPDTSFEKNKKKSGVVNNYCSATPFSQGEDWIVTYVYSLVVINGVQHRYAYVACNYVQ